ncbi:hypothetical protein O181_095576 [Austropuccinia psidii MF-1]|uniref:PITH domain-containing protein n=1 Tax=Austropuccinia psidii MF-1 TaxID=1389203 RepID=A0A9Q3PDF9_9BASI|nr:hypothetical protein [Austropuccinia psidii MF-1]
MPHHHPSHDHGCCSHEAGQPDDQHIRPEEGTQDLLYSKIDKGQVSGCNVEPSRPAKDCIKPWTERSDDQNFTQSDMDQQMILHIPFTGSVKLRAVIIRTLPGVFRPTQAHLYANEPSLDFDALESRPPTQILEIPETTEVVEFPVRVAKFSSLTSLSIFFNAPSNIENTRVYFLGFKGEFTNLSRKPVIAIYEAQANPSDHEKVSGLGDALNRTI